MSADDIEARDPRDIDTLLALMARLRDPHNGCPWDREQDFSTIAPYTIEEAYEVADAIARDDLDALKDELGDLLFQSVFHARLAEEQGAFRFEDVVAAVVTKMVRRHPHVFGDADARNGSAVRATWEELKAEERAAKGPATQGLLDDVPLALPALTRAVKLQKRAGRVGFDWGETGAVLAKIAEEAGELAAEVDAGAPPARIEDELGDLLFVVANLARHLDVDPEKALRGTNEKFVRRFWHIEETLGERLGDASLEEMDALWDEAKALERKA